MSATKGGSVECDKGWGKVTFRCVNDECICPRSGEEFCKDCNYKENPDRPRRTPLGAGAKDGASRDATKDMLGRDVLEIFRDPEASPEVKEMVAEAIRILSEKAKRKENANQLD
ncbi:MAG TPA: hypothetical protein VM054_03680 [bacterium]|nr:hypothetical protein [bacterium]